MSVNLQELYRQKRVLMTRWRKAAREGTLEAVVLPLIPRNPAEISEAEEAAGDIDQPSGIWCTTILNLSEGQKGGATSMSTIATAAEHLVFRPHSLRLSTAAERDSELARQQALLENRISGARRLSLREDSAFGKRN
jgi:hypothetical protein